MTTTSLTTTEVAKLVKRDPSRIRQIILANPSLGTKHGRDWSISPANLRGIRKLLKSETKCLNSRLR
jgi:hypothetical protein